MRNIIVIDIGKMTLKEAKLKIEEVKLRIVRGLTKQETKFE